MKIYKSKWYICRFLYEDPEDPSRKTGRCAEAWRGAFRTESQAFNSMYENDPDAKQSNGLPQRRKKEYTGRFPCKGKRIMEVIERTKVEW